jgi:hypothetical protein
VAWIAFELILFSMPTAIPVTESTMNYASVVWAGFMALAGLWYIMHARHGKQHLPNVRKRGETHFYIVTLALTRVIAVYQGPPESDGLTVGS